MTRSESTREHPQDRSDTWWIFQRCTDRFKRRCNERCAQLLMKVSGSGSIEGWFGFSQVGVIMHAGGTCAIQMYDSDEQRIHGYPIDELHILGKYEFPCQISITEETPTVTSILNQLFYFPQSITRETTGSRLSAC